MIKFKKPKMSEIYSGVSPYLNRINGYFNAYVKREIDDETYLESLSEIEKRCEQAIGKATKIKFTNKKSKEPAIRNIALFNAGLREFIEGIRVMKTFTSEPIDVAKVETHVNKATKLLTEYQRSMT